MPVHVKNFDNSAVSEAFSGLTKDQIASLIALLPNVNPNSIAVSSANLVSSYNISSQPSSGTATDHFTCSLHWFSSFYSIKPIPVSLPNGETAVALYKGTHNVLYVARFPVNIISITKLTKALDCKYVFTHNVIRK
jgi:hypothetical protein